MPRDESGVDECNAVKREVKRQASDEKRSEAHAGTQQQSPQKSESAHTCLRVERTRREDPRHRIAYRGKIHSARTRLAKLRRPGSGGKLLPARRTLFSSDRGRAGTIPPAEPVLQQPATAAGTEPAAGCSRRQL